MCERTVSEAKYNLRLVFVPVFVGGGRGGSKSADASVGWSEVVSRRKETSEKRQRHVKIFSSVVLYLFNYFTDSDCIQIKNCQFCCQKDSFF